MKGVLIGTDYVKDVDGSFKVLEINTSIGFSWNNASNYFSTGGLDAILSGSSVSEAHLIGTTLTNSHTNDLSASFSELNMQSSVQSLLTQYLTGSGYTVTIHHGSNGIVPEVEDADNKFIIRQAYDQTATFDETYAKDSYKFLKTVHDQDSSAIPNTFIPNTGSAASFTFDTIGDSWRNNGNFPNYLIKERYPTTDYSSYPKLIKAADADAVAALKTSLTDSEYLQEYIIDTSNLVDGKIPTYRTIDLIHGSSLERVNMTNGQILTTLSPLGTDIDYTDSNEVQTWDRTKLIHKTSNLNSTNPIGLDQNLLLSGSGINISGSDLTMGTVVKTFNIPDLAEASASSDPNRYTYTWTGSAEFSIASGSLINTSVVGYTDTPQMSQAIELELEDGKKINLALNSNIYLKSGSDTTYFKSLEALVGREEENDITTYSVMSYNNATSTLESKAIVGSQFFWAYNGGFNINVEDTDTYFIEDSSDSNSFVILHNSCRGTQFYGSGYCDACGPNSTYQFYSSTAACCNFAYGSATLFYTPSCAFGK